jgi:hypothetical protein
MEWLFHNDKKLNLSKIAPISELKINNVVEPVFLADHPDFS